MRAVCFAVVLAALSLAPAASAAEPQPQKAAKKEAIDPAYQVAQMVTPRASWDLIVRSIVDMMQDQMTNSVGIEFSSEDLVEVMNQVLSYEEMLDMSAGLFKKYYTDEEIKQIQVFYSSPLGQKFIKNQPKIVADTQGMIQAKMADPALMATIQKKIEEKMKKKPMKTHKN